MSVWTEDQFASRAKDLAKAHVGTKTPINDLVEKVAREAELTPDAIRTLGRFTNVAVFQEMFSQKAASAEPDRMVEFEPGDPETVIQRVVKSAAIQSAAQPTSEKTAIELPDMMQSVRFPGDETAKEASAPDELPRSAPRNLEQMRLRKMAQELEVTAVQTAQRWESGMAKLAAIFKRAPGYGPSFHDFEKDAMAEWGGSVRAELEALRQDLRLPPKGVLSDKEASFFDTHVVVESEPLRILRQVVSDRENYEIIKLARTQVLERLN